MELVIAAALGFVGGIVGGMLGVGGGILFVPALALVLDEPQIRAEATSLLAIVPVALAGTWRQHRYGNVALREAAWIGGLSLPGVALGVAMANAISGRALEIAFAGLLLMIAAQLAYRALRPSRS